MSCVWLNYMVKYFQCKNCVGSSLKTKNAWHLFQSIVTRRSKVRFAPAYFLSAIENKPSARSLAPPFRKKSRQAHPFDSKRPRDGSLSLPTFCEFERVQLPSPKYQKHFLVLRHIKPPLSSEPLVFGYQWCFCYKPNVRVDLGISHLKYCTNNAAISIGNHTGIADLLI